MAPTGRPKEDYSLKETSPDIGGQSLIGNDKLTLVEQRHFLYVRVVRAKDLPVNDKTDTCEPFVEVNVGKLQGTIKHLESTSNPEWNQVFAFTRDQLEGSLIEILVKDKEAENNEIIGRVAFELGDISSRFAPDSPLAPHWYKLEDRNGNKVTGEVMLAVWIGNQADEAFSVAWHSDAAAVSTERVANTRSKVYISPRLWYLRINVIGAQDLVSRERNRKPEAYVKAILGNLVLRTKVSMDKTLSPNWNEELVFVAAEPFDDPLILSVMDKTGPSKEECLGTCVIPLQELDRSLVVPCVGDKWINLQRPLQEGEELQEVRIASRLHMGIVLDGMYHVFDEPTYYCSDLRATSPDLWQSKIGVLELGILKAEGLLPMKSKDGRGTTDAYCVAKYGQKWVRTSTIVDSSAPKWNEQYYWDVYDPCTVITIGVFDNGHLQEGEMQKDPRIGKVRIRLSTLETGRIYTHSYPLIVLQPNGLKKMGELHLAVRFTCTSLFDLLRTYARPLLPEMHYKNPFSVYQLDSLRYQAIYVLALRLNRADPPLRKEVVDYMLDSGVSMWSLRRGKANCERVIACLSGIFALWRWFDKIRKWKQPVPALLVLSVLILMAILPRLILPMFFFFLFIVGVSCYPKRPRHPAHMDTRLSHAEHVHPDELDEEFDAFPSSKNGEVLRRRYDRLRSIGGRLIMMIGDLATQLERVNSLLSWRDPRATLMFLIFCLIAAVVLYWCPYKTLGCLAVLYLMRPSYFSRCTVPPLHQYFLRRLPAKADSML